MFWWAKNKFPLNNDNETHRCCLCVAVCSFQAGQVFSGPSGPTDHPAHTSLCTLSLPVSGTPPSCLSHMNRHRYMDTVKSQEVCEGVVYDITCNSSRDISGKEQSLHRLGSGQRSRDTIQWWRPWDVAGSSRKDFVIRKKSCLSNCMKTAHLLFIHFLMI